MTVKQFLKSKGHPNYKVVTRKGKVFSEHYLSELLEEYAELKITDLKDNHKKDVIEAFNSDRPNLLVFTTGEAAEHYYNETFNQ